MRLAGGAAKTSDWHCKKEPNHSRHWSINNLPTDRSPPRLVMKINLHSTCLALAALTTAEASWSMPWQQQQHQQQPGYGFMSNMGMNPMAQQPPRSTCPFANNQGQPPRRPCPFANKPAAGTQPAQSTCPFARPQGAPPTAPGGVGGQMPSSPTTPSYNPSTPSYNQRPSYPDWNQLRQARRRARDRARRLRQRMQRGVSNTFGRMGEGFGRMRDSVGQMASGGGYGYGGGWGSERDYGRPYY